MTINVAFIAPDIDSKTGGHGTFVKSTNNNFRNFLAAKCFLIYDRKHPEESKNFDAKFQYTNGCGPSLQKFLTDNKINFIIELGIANINIVELWEVAKACNCKIISMVHAKPDFIKVSPSYHSLFWELKSSTRITKKINKTLKIIFFPFYKEISNYKYKKWRKELYSYSDKVVVLSKFYIENYVRLLNLKNSSKVRAIPNPLPFSELFDPKQLDQKKNEVLIVSRLSESCKYLSRVLKVWRIIEKNESLSDWKLRIVGGGEDEGRYKKMAKKYNPKSVYFEGVQQPILYYKKAKIFLISSLHEGFPMTLLEANQMGLPIVGFNNFESLKELVIDGYNGFIIPKNNLKLFAIRLVQIMKNDELRTALAKNSIFHSQLFTPEKITKQWSILFNELLNEN